MQQALAELELVELYEVQVEMVGSARSQGAGEEAVQVAN
jgi:hypothetical protein